MSLVERGEQAVKESTSWGLGGTRYKGGTVRAGVVRGGLRGLLWGPQGTTQTYNVVLMV